MSEEQALDREQQLQASWRRNAGRWTEAVREGAIASRARGTDRAILAAVEATAATRILDLGCGEGWLARALAARGLAVTGIDGSPELIARARAGGAGEFRCLDYAALALEPSLQGCFEVVVANFALLGEDLETPLRAARECLEPGGCLLIQTLHPVGVAPPYEPGWRLESFAGFGGDEGGDAWAPMPWYFHPLGSWVAAARDQGLSLIAVEEPLDPETRLPLSLLLTLRA